LGQSVNDCIGDVALAETHVTAHHRLVAEDGDRDTVIGGRYLDRMDKRGAHWRITQRTSAPSRSKADPSYQRPLVNRRDIHNPSDG
jgi:hypothetical protein